LRSCSRDITTTSFLPLGRNQFGNQKTRKKKEPEAKLFSNSPGFLASELISSDLKAERIGIEYPRFLASELISPS
jgi:hypothetical protein